LQGFLISIKTPPGSTIAHIQPGIVPVNLPTIQDVNHMLERMTPDELARLTGYSRQTINKWVRKEGWTTSPKPGVQGGKARLVHVNEQVREYIRNAERPEGQGEAPALSGDAPLEVLLVTLAKEMTPVEQKQFTSLLLREGIIGLLQRLGIRDSK
jgi:predicted DNA-binding transcriptional regulator AlpA